MLITAVLDTLGAPRSELRERRKLSRDLFAHWDESKRPSLYVTQDPSFRAKFSKWVDDCADGISVEDIRENRTLGIRLIYFESGDLHPIRYMIAEKLNDDDAFLIVTTSMRKKIEKHK